MIRKFITSLKALELFMSEVSSFNPKAVFGNKRVAVIGAAATAFEEENGDYIDSFDIVVRINKALVTWQPTQEKYIGKRTDVLFHNFYENESSGGGPIHYELFLREFQLKYLVHPDNSWRGYRTHLNFYKRHLKKIPTHLLLKKEAAALQNKFINLMPTVGFFALYTLLNSNCKELYVSGFTFFKTPYAKGYRDQLLDHKENERHMKNQGLHDPDLEFELFKTELRKSSIPKIILDKGLDRLVNQGS